MKLEKLRVGKMDKYALCEACGEKIHIDELGSILPSKIKGGKPRLYHKDIFYTFKLLDDIEEMENGKK